MSKLSVGIVGLPNVGKSTLFNALTLNSVPAENYPFCTIDPSVGVVGVPDARLATLAQLSESAETIPAAIEFVDIAGLVKGASAGEGLGNKFLSNIREVDMIAHVVRIFDDTDLHHVSGVIDPMADVEVINLELIMADLEAVSKRRGNLDKQIKAGDADAKALATLCDRLVPHLESGQLAQTLSFSDTERELLRELHLLTMKPVLYVCNKKYDSYNLDENNDDRWTELTELFSEQSALHVTVDAGVEHELKDLDGEEKTEFRREYGAQDSGIDTLIQRSYERLGLMSYFTTGPKETRAWTVEQGSTAPEAAGVIHSDFREKFIRAQVVAFTDLVSFGSMAKAKEAGRLRTEGKEYIVQDGDVMEFLHG